MAKLRDTTVYGNIDVTGNIKKQNKEVLTEIEIGVVSSGSPAQATTTHSNGVTTLNLTIPPGAKGDTGDAGYELIKDRAATTNLTSITNNSYATLTSNIAVGDTLMVEINSAASYSYNPKIITFTVGSNSTTTSEYNSVTWMTWTGSEQKTYSTFPYFNASYPARLYFSNNRTITGAYTGNNIIYTTATAQTFYVGRIWRVKR